MTATFIDLDGAEVNLKLSFIIIILLASTIIPIAFYLLRSFGIYKLAKNQEIKKAWLAFIPFAWFYPAGKIVGDIRIFNFKIKNFAVVALWSFLSVGVLNLALDVLNYIPLVGYLMQGGNVLVSATEEFFPNGTYYFSVLGTYVCAPNMLMPYSEGLITAFNAISTVLGIAELFLIVLEIGLYINLFKCYLPRHYLTATIFSILGLFGPFVFAVRKNEKFDYDAYMRAQYQRYNQMNNPYGNPYNDPYTQNRDHGQKRDSAQVNNDSPFDEFNSSDMDPFDEFNNNGDKK